MLDLIPKKKLNNAIFGHLIGKCTDFSDWVRGAYAKIDQFSKSTRVLLVLPLGVGGPLPKFWSFSKSMAYLS